MRRQPRRGTLAYESGPPASARRLRKRSVLFIVRKARSRNARRRAGAGSSCALSSAIRGCWKGMARSNMGMSPRPACSANHAPTRRIMLAAGQCFKDIWWDRSTGSAAMQLAGAPQQQLTWINASADGRVSLNKNVRETPRETPRQTPRETPWEILLSSSQCRSTGPMLASCRGSPSNAPARPPRSSAPRAIGRFSATPVRSPLFGPVIPNIRRQCSDDLAPCPTSCDLRKDRPSGRPFGSKHTAGKVRGHASLMQPTKPSPGVPFVALPLYHGPNAHHDTIAVLSAEVESSNLPSAWLTNVIAARGDTVMLLPSDSPVKPEHPGRGRSNCVVVRHASWIRRPPCVVRSGLK